MLTYNTKTVDLLCVNSFNVLNSIFIVYLEGHSWSVFFVIEPFGGRLGRLIFINNQHYWDILQNIMSFDKTVRDLGIVIGDCALSFADTSGSVFVDPDLLCSRLLVKLIGW